MSVIFEKLCRIAPRKIIIKNGELNYVSKVFLVLNFLHTQTHHNVVVVDDDDCCLSKLMTLFFVGGNSESTLCRKIMQRLLPTFLLNRIFRARNVIYFNTIKHDFIAGDYFVVADLYIFILQKSKQMRIEN
jgi:hypothetical protein